MSQTSKTIFISGANGQLGRSIKELAKDYSDYSFRFFSKEKLDLSNESSIKSVLSEQCDYFINAGAYTAVDKAEENEDLCMAINATALRHVAKYCSENCRIIHISSDYVYHHNPGRPLEETDNTEPKSVYAHSKLDGEKQLFTMRPDSIVIRSSWIYAKEGHNFVNTMLRLGEFKEELTIVSDQIGTPTYAPDLAKTIMDLIRYQDSNPNTTASGIFNYSNEGTCNWAEFAKEIFKIRQISCKVIPIPTEQYPTPAQRPLWSVMSKEKIKALLQIEIPNWKSSLRKCLDNE